MEMRFVPQWQIDLGIRQLKNLTPRQVNDRLRRAEDRMHRAAEAYRVARERTIALHKASEQLHK